MKSIKKISSLILVFLLSFPEISICSWSWWENVVQTPIRSITQSIDKDTAKKLFPLAILVGLASVVGFYYWMSKKEKGRDEESAGDGENILPHNPKYSLNQYTIYSQKKSDGGGPASCGYHALLRSMQVVQSKSKNVHEKDLIERLQKTWAIQIYFLNPDSDWRSKIIIGRKKKILKNELHNNFLSLLKTGEDLKTIELYKSALGSLEEKIISLVDDVVGNKEYKITNDEIKQYIRNGLEKLKNPENHEKIEELEKSINMQEHLSISGIMGAVFSEKNVLRPSDLLQNIMRRPDPNGELKGDWLDEGEIEFLWEYEKNKQKNSLIPDDIICELKAIPNPEYIDREGFDEVTPFIQEQIAMNRERNKQMFLVFILGEGMQQIGDTGTTSGHWYALVMHQNRLMNREYYIMDSMGDDRTKDATALKVINLLENIITKQ